MVRYEYREYHHEIFPIPTQTIQYSRGISGQVCRKMFRRSCGGGQYKTFLGSDLVPNYPPNAVFALQSRGRDRMHHHFLTE